MSAHQQCDRPPVGWSCSRESDHEGPCAARQVGEMDAEAVLGWLVEGHKRNATTSKNDNLTEWQKDAYRAALDLLELPPDYLEYRGAF